MAAVMADEIRSEVTISLTLPIRHNEADIAQVRFVPMKSPPA
jgi:hypothetical protein